MALKGTKNIIDIRNFGLAGAIQITHVTATPSCLPVRSRHGIVESRVLRAVSAATPCSSAQPSAASRRDLDRGLFDAVGEVLGKDRLISSHIPTKNGCAIWGAPVDNFSGASMSVIPHLINGELVTENGQRG